MIGTLLITAASVRSVEAIPLSNTEATAAEICALFDCIAGVAMSDTYSFAPLPDPDGDLLSFIAPGLDPAVAGKWLYLYQVVQDAASTVVVAGVGVPFVGIFPPGFSLFCSDCGGSQAPSVADYSAAPEAINFLLAGLGAGESSALFGAISSFAPTVGEILISNSTTTSAEGFIPSAVPEPASMMLFGVAIAAIAARRRIGR
jgi:hypothetical protein